MALAITQLRAVLRQFGLMAVRRPDSAYLVLMPIDTCPVYCDYCRGVAKDSNGSCSGCGAALDAAI